MSLGFLSKKSWHTSNIKNVEKVWVREQQEQAEKKKMMELRRNIEEERQREELEKLQEKAGLRKCSTKLAWMYEGPKQNASPEELMSKVPEEILDQDKGQELVEQNQDAAGSLWLQKTISDPNEKFRRLNEDPLFAIRRLEQKKYQDVVSNPIKMRMAKDRAEQVQKRSKKSKKHKKSNKRKRKKHKHSSSDDSSNTTSDKSEDDKSSHDRTSRTSKSRKRRRTDSSDSPPSRRHRHHRHEYRRERRYEDRRAKHHEDDHRSKEFHGRSDPEKSRSRGLSQAEKQARLQRMKADGESHMNEQRARTKAEEEQREMEERELERNRGKRSTQDPLAPGNGKAEFLKQIHNDLISNSTMETRIQSQRHYQQRPLESSNFFL